jgi:diadenosine tetraphosphate (Ap4A) HIT family hydrolase
MSTDPNCPFCKRTPTPEQSWGDNLVWQFPHSFAVLGQWQYYTGYCVLISRRHVAELSELGPDRLTHLQEMAWLAEAIEKCFQPYKLNYELLGNQVRHIHWHLFPRSADDPDRLRPAWFALDRTHEPAEKARLEKGTVPRVECVIRLREWLKQNVPG